MKRSSYLILISISLVSISSVFSFYKKFFHPASFSLEINPQEAIEIASKFLEEEGYELKGYKKIVNFYEWREISFFLQRIKKLEKAKEIFGDKFPVWYWSVRFFKPGEEEEFRVSINSESGEVTFFSHHIPQDKKIESISGDEAKMMAFDYLKKMGIDISKFPNIDYWSQSQPYRLDQYFTLTSIPLDLRGAKLGFCLGIFGNKVGTYYATVSIPESFRREFLAQNSFSQFLGIASIAILVILTIISIIYLILFTKKGYPIKWKNSFILAGIITFISLLSTINFIPTIWFNYHTAIPLKIYFIIIGAILMLIGILILGYFVLIFSVGEALTNVAWNRPLVSFLSGFGYFKSKEFGKKILIGYCWGGIFLGCLFWSYYIFQKLGKIWIFMSPTLFGGIASVFPFLLPIMIGVTSAFGEEFVFRGISIALFKKWFRYSVIAIILSAFLWGLGHVTIEIYPVYFRIIEMTILGIVLAILFLKFGIEVTIAVHFFINSFALSYLLIDLGLPYLRFSGLVAIAISLIPLIALFCKNSNLGGETS